MPSGGANRKAERRMGTRPSGAVPAMAPTVSAQAPAALTITGARYTPLVVVTSQMPSLRSSDTILALQTMLLPLARAPRRKPCNSASTSMSDTSFSSTAPMSCSSRSTGRKDTACLASKRSTNGDANRAVASYSASSSSWPGPAKNSAPRGASNAFSQKPCGGFWKKSRLARVSARTCSGP